MEFSPEVLLLLTITVEGNDSSYKRNILDTIQQ